MKILNLIGKVESHSDLSNQFVLRNAQITDQTSDAAKLLDIGGGSLTLNSYLLGDVNGDYFS